MACNPKPKAPNGNESKLYDTIVEDLGYTRDKALEVYKDVYSEETQEFLSGSNAVDENGEPYIYYIDYLDRQTPVLLNFYEPVPPGTNITRLISVDPSIIKYLDRNIPTKNRTSQLRSIENSYGLRNIDGTVKTLGTKEEVDLRIGMISDANPTVKLNASSTRSKKKSEPTAIGIICISPCPVQFNKSLVIVCPPIFTL